MEGSAGPLPTGSHDVQVPAALPPSADLIELQKLLNAAGDYLECDTQYLALVISKDVKATHIQTSYRGHMVTPTPRHPALGHVPMDFESHFFTGSCATRATEAHI